MLQQLQNGEDGQLSMYASISIGLWARYYPGIPLTLRTQRLIIHSVQSSVHLFDLFEELFECTKELDSG